MRTQQYLGGARLGQTMNFVRKLDRAANFKIVFRFLVCPDAADGRTSTALQSSLFFPP